MKLLKLLFDLNLKFIKRLYFSNKRFILNYTLEKVPGTGHEGIPTVSYFESNTPNFNSGNVSYMLTSRIIRTNMHLSLSKIYKFFPGKYKYQVFDVYIYEHYKIHPFTL